MTQVNDKQRFDIKNFDHQVIVAGMVALAEKGFTPHQIFELLESIKNEIWPSLAEISREARKS